jgi:hypothetical protein
LIQQIIEHLLILHPEERSEPLQLLQVRLNHYTPRRNSTSHYLNLNADQEPTTRYVEEALVAVESVK